MNDPLDEFVAAEDLKKYEIIYYAEVQNSKVTAKVQFEYAWCLVRSKYPADISKGIMLFEDLYGNSQGENDTYKRDCLYYLAIGNARLKDYTVALSYVRAILYVEPQNQQLRHLETLITKKMEKEGLTGLAVLGGLILGVAGVLGLGIAMAKKL